MGALVIRAAYVNGYGVTFGDAYRDRRIYQIIEWAFAHGYADGLPKPKCHPESLHFSRLAVDLNLFRGVEYITDATGHKELHDLWESMGGAKMIEGDPNHYSLARNGMM